jgi:hypothetical protein
MMMVTAGVPCLREKKRKEILSFSNAYYFHEEHELRIIFFFFSSLPPPLHSAGRALKEKRIYINSVKCFSLLCCCLPKKGKSASSP